MSWLDSPSETVVADGCAIRYRRVGTRGAPPVLLVHGGGGHSGWWLNVVPDLARRHEVLAVDLSGHGDSGHRAEYGPATWVGDLTAVIEAADAGPVHLVGHSMGGLITVHVAGQRPELVRTLTVVDSAVLPLSVNGGRRQPSPVKFYASLEEGLANFRLRPRGTTASPETLAEVGRAGLRRETEGWRWKFDPKTVGRVSREEVIESARSIRCPVGFLYGEHSELVDARTVDHLEAALNVGLWRSMVAGAYHHVPIDAPAETVAGIDRSVAATV